MKLCYNHRELATILAALRLFQEQRPNTEHFEEVEPLNNDEIDTLCERLNASPAEELSEAINDAVSNGDETVTLSVTSAKAIEDLLKE